MNQLSVRTQTQVLNMLVEGCSLSAVARLTDVSYPTILKLLVDAGDVCRTHHDETVRDVEARYVQVDEMWGFVYAKQTNTPWARGGYDRMGDIYTWVGIDTDTKLVLSWYVGNRDSGAADVFMHDLSRRLSNRTQLSSDGFNAYPDAVDRAFGNEVDYYQRVHGESTNGMPDEINGSYVERHNLTMRMAIKRLTRKSNAFSRRYTNHVAHLALYFTYYNFCRAHASIGTTPAIASGLTDDVLDLACIAEMVNGRRATTRRFRRQVA